MWDLLFANLPDYQRLDYVWRFSSIPTVSRENVSAHSYWVTFYSTLIYETLDKGGSLLPNIMLCALMHDFIEGHTGDFVRTFKYSSPDLKKSIEDAEEKELKNYPDQIRSLYDQVYKDKNDEEIQLIKAIVKAADFISLFGFMRREYVRGNREVKPFYKIMVNDLFRMSSLPDVNCGSIRFEQSRFYSDLAFAAEAILKEHP